MDWAIIGTVIGTGVAVLGVLVTVILSLHRDMSRRVDAVSLRVDAVNQRVDEGFRHLNDRMDRHLEGHAPKVPQA